MNYKGNNNQCDICASKGCSNCIGKATKVKVLDLMDMYYCGAQFVELVHDKTTDTVLVNPIDRAEIKDIGILATKSHFPCRPADTVFYPCKVKYEDILGDKLQMITSGSVAFWSKEVTKKIVAYTLNDGEVKKK
jgi:hypothetical protein